MPLSKRVLKGRDNKAQGKKRSDATLGKREPEHSAESARQRNGHALVCLALSGIKTLNGAYPGFHLGFVVSSFQDWNK